MNDIKIIILSILLIFGALSVWSVGIIPLGLSLTYLVIMLALLTSYLLFHNKTLAENIILAFSISLIFAACADIALRLTISDRIFYRPHDKYILKFPQQKELSRYKANQRFEGDIFGDLAAMTGDKSLCQHRNITFQTDQRGFRNYPQTEQDSIDIILLGDSFGMGSGTTQDHTWASILTEKYKLNTYSISIPGSPWHELINLKIEAPTLKTKPGTIVLWALFSGNDLNENYFDTLEPELHTGFFYTNWIKLNTFRNRSPIRLIIRGILVSNGDKVVRDPISDTATMLFYQPYSANSQLSAVEIQKHRNFSHLVSVINEMKRFTDENDLMLQIVTIPQKSEVYPLAIIPGTEYRQNGFSATIQQLCQNSDINFLDLGEGLFKAAQEEYTNDNQIIWWLDDTHWNNLGHEIASEIIFNEIKKDSRK